MQRSLIGQSFLLKRLKAGNKTRILSFLYGKGIKFSFIYAFKMAISFRLGEKPVFF